MIQIDLQSRVPLYEQLQEQIIRLSMLGILDENQQLPSVRALAREVGVNPNTVAKAYQQLEQQGIIYTVSGRGSFVSPDVLSLQPLRQAALQEVLDAVDKALSRGVSPQQLLDAVRQQLDSLSPCNQGGSQDD
ncbi:MAG: GntR family transcriptional regulator [Negativibacillus sp.]|nr:GntR family transcriptional regulator [Negativibacillus sp.]